MALSGVLTYIFCQSLYPGGIDGKILLLQISGKRVLKEFQLTTEQKDGEKVKSLLAFVADSALTVVRFSLMPPKRKVTQTR